MVRGLIEVELRTSRPFSCCLVCGTSSRQVHGRYQHRLGDLPWEGVPVSICFRPASSSVASRLAAGASLPNRFPALCFAIVANAAFCEAMDWITVMIGGQAGARLAHRLGLLVSGSTLLRQLSLPSTTCAGCGSACARYRRLGVAKRTSLQHGTVRSG